MRQPLLLGPKTVCMCVCVWMCADLGRCVCECVCGGYVRVLV